MKKVKVTLQHQVPLWNYCNSDTPTSDLRFSKEVCRFCVKSKGSNRCLLYATNLAADANFVYKHAKCIEATTNSSDTITDTVTQALDPQIIIRETIKSYTQTVASLVKQGYPQSLAESLAMQYMTGRK